MSGLVCLVDYPQLLCELLGEAVFGTPCHQLFFGCGLSLGSDEVGHHVPLDKRTNEESIFILEQLGIVRGEPHITADALVGVVVSLGGGFSLHVGEGLRVRLADVVMVCGFNCGPALAELIHQAYCLSAGFRHVGTDGEGVMGIIVGNIPTIYVLFGEVIQFATFGYSDFIPALIVERSLE